jgi:hypothetical protein
VICLVINQSVLDKARCELGEHFSKLYGYRKGKIMLEIEKKRSYNQVVSATTPSVTEVSAESPGRYEISSRLLDHMLLFFVGVLCIRSSCFV